jgi:hypothetical protein
MTYPLRILASPGTAPLRAEVETLVRRCHELGVLYASDDWSPLSDITLGLLLKRAGIQWRYCELEPVGEIVWPPVCGIHLLQLDRYQPRLERRFALRHGLAHVLAGHVADLTCAHDGHHWENPEEQLADAFAFADLIPDRMLCEMQAVGFRDKGLKRWVRAEISRYAPDWPVERVADRTETRLRVP